MSDFDVQSQSDSVFDNDIVYSDSDSDSDSDNDSDSDSCFDDIRTQSSSVYDSDVDSDYDSDYDSDDEGFCMLCYHDSEDLCVDCAEKLNVCLNCVAYGINGNVCENCEMMGDEGIDLTSDLRAVLEYIERNRLHFLLKYKQCEICGDSVEDTAYGPICKRHIPSYALW